MSLTDQYIKSWEKLRKKLLWRKFRQLGDIIEFWEIISIRGWMKEKARLRDNEIISSEKKKKKKNRK